MLKNCCGQYKIGGENVKCSHCGSKNIVHKGKRKTLRFSNQIYLCKNCGRHFSLKQGKFDPLLILHAVSAYNSNKSLSETVDLISKRFRVSISRMTILRWVKLHGGPYLRLRNRLSEKYPEVDTMISKQFVHSGLVYSYTLHLHKLKEFCKYEGLAKYLMDIDSWIDKYFSSGMRCSQMKPVSSVDVEGKKNFLCDAADLAISACSELKERHSLVQKHLLSNDSCTIATEIPVYMWDKDRGAICGHIDVLQIRFGKIWVVDFKPGAKFVDKNKVSAQLYWYSRALSFRSKIPLSEFRCCWFDSEVCFEFNPCNVKIDNAAGSKPVTSGDGIVTAGCNTQASKM